MDTETDPFSAENVEPSISVEEMDGDSNNVSVSLKKSDSIRYSLDQEELPRQSSADQNNGMEGRSKSSETVTKAKDSALPPKPKKKSFVDSKRGQINEVSQWGDGAVGSDTSTTGEKEGGQVSEASKQSKLNGIARKPSGTPELKSPRAAHYKTVDEMVEEAENKALEAKKHRIARNRHKKEESDIDEDSNSQISKDRKLPAIRSARAMYDNNSNSLIVPVRHPLNSLDDSDGESQGRIHSQSSPTGASGKKRKKPLYLRMIAKAQMKLTEEEKERHEKYLEQKRERAKNNLSLAEIREHMARHDQLMKAKQVAAAASVINASPLPKKRRPRFFDDEISKRKSKSIAMNSGSTESLQKASSADQESSNSVSSDARGSHGIYSESNKSQSKLKARSSSPAYKSIEETTEASEKHIKALAPKTKMPVIPTGKRPPGKAKNTFNDLVLPDRSEYRSIEVEGKASPRKEFSLNSKGVSPNIPELSTSFLVTNSPKKANTHTVSPTKSTADNIQLASIAAPLEEPANVNVDPQLLEIISDEASLKSFVDRGWMNRMGITSPFEESEMMRLEYALEVF